MIKHLIYKKFKPAAHRMLCFLILTVWITGVHGATRTSVTSGDWNDPNTWSPAGIPQSNDNVTISDGDTVTVASNEAAQTLTVSTSGVLTWSTGDSLTINGTFTVNGTVKMNEGNIILPVS